MTTTVTHGNYESFREKRNVLSFQVERQLSLLSSLRMAGWEESIQHLKKRVSTDTFKILVVGEFKRGKSTFINAMLGEEILPAYATPCTAIINEVKWGESPQALLYFPKSESGSNRPPEEIPIDQIEEYVAIKHEVGENYINLYEKVEIFWPVELCRNGVELIDSPGLNEHTTREQITMDYLSIVDAVVFVLSCDALASQSELRVINNNLRAVGHEDVFFICNRFDQIREKEKDQVKKFGLSKLAPLTRRGEKGVFFISAADALDGRLAGDEQKVIKSGVTILERELEEFLTTDRGRLKIIEPAKYLRQSIDEAQRTIPEREAMLRTDREVLEKRYIAAQEPLKQLEIKREQIGTRISHFCSDKHLQIQEKACRFYESLPEKVQGWIQEYELEAKITIFKVNKFPSDEEIRVQVNEIVFELASHLTSQIENEFIPWQARELQPFLISRLSDLKLDLDARASEFIRQVDEIRAQLASGETYFITTKRKGADLERLFYAGSFLGNSGSTGVFLGINSWSEIKSIGGKIVAAALASLVVIGLCAWVVIPAVIVVLATVAEEEFNKANQRVEQKIKETISRKFGEELRKSAKEQARKFADDIVLNFSNIQVVVDEGLSKEIQSIREQVDSILQEKQKGQAHVEKKLRELVAISKELETIDSEVDNFISEFDRL